MDPRHLGTDPDMRIRTTDRIRILLFLSVAFKISTKSKFLLFEGTFTSVLKRKSHKEFTKQVEIKFFHTFFCSIMEGSGSVQILTEQDPGGPKTYGSGSTTLVTRFSVFFS